MFCPHCDKRLSPDHRCLSRRVFLFSGLGAVFGLAPKMWPNPLIHSNWGARVESIRGVAYFMQTPATEDLYLTRTQFRKFARMICESRDRPPIRIVHLAEAKWLRKLS